MTIKGYLKLRRFWWSWTRGYWIRKYYEIFHNINYNGVHCSILPDTRDNSQFKRVQCKGHYIDITDKETGDFIRIIPVTYNHGIMVENWINGKLNHRTLLKYEQLTNDYIYTTNAEREGQRIRDYWTEKDKK